MQMFQRIGSGLGNVSWCLVGKIEPQGADTQSHIPRNSTQLISISSLSPSADNGRSASRVRKMKGPISGAGRLSRPEAGCSTSCVSIVKELALRLT